MIIEDRIHFQIAGSEAYLMLKHKIVNMEITDEHYIAGFNDAINSHIKKTEFIYNKQYQFGHRCGIYFSLNPPKK